MPGPPWLWCVALAELESGSFPSWSELEGELRGTPDLIQQPVEHLIGMGRIVMKRHKPLDTSRSGEGNGLRQCAMPPAYMRQVFGRGVLGIVNKQIYPCR